MTEHSERDSYRINEFILNAALKKQPIFKAYERLCEIEGNRKLDYVDFEWKYYQYYHGNRDLAIERSPDNSSPVTISDLPIDVLEKVVTKSNVVDCLVLRKVSRDLRNLVDSAEIRCERVYFSFSDYFSIIAAGNSHISYQQSSDGCCEVCVGHSLPNLQRYKSDRTAQKTMFADASAILQNPKLKIGRLQFENVEACSEFFDFFKSLGFQLNVRSVKVSADRESTLPIVQLMKPKTLEEIRVKSYFLTVEQFDEITKTEQWKMAEKLWIEQIPYGVGMKKMAHFKKIRINEFHLSDENLVMVRDILLKSAHLESCLLGFVDFPRHFGDELEYSEDEDDDEENVKDEDDNVASIMSSDPCYDPKTRRFSIPNSNEYFQLKYWIYKLAIKRTTDKRSNEEFIRDSA